MKRKNVDVIRIAWNDILGAYSRTYFAWDDVLGYAKMCCNMLNEDGITLYANKILGWLDAAYAELSEKLNKFRQIKEDGKNLNYQISKEDEETLLTYLNMIPKIRDGVDWLSKMCVFDVTHTKNKAIFKKAVRLWKPFSEKSKILLSYARDIGSDIAGWDEWIKLPQQELKVSGQFTGRTVPPSIDFIRPDGLYIDAREYDRCGYHYDVADIMLKTVQKSEHGKMIDLMQMGYIRFLRSGEFSNDYVIIQTETCPTPSQFATIRNAVELVGEGVVEITKDGRCQEYFEMFRDTIDRDMRKFEALLNKVKSPQPKIK